jgi:phosphoglycerate-specific signal transduction histidine kinase
MKNLKLSTKLLLLTAILSLFLAITGYVGWSRMAELDANTTRIGNKSYPRAILATDARTTLLSMIRAQKNCIISTDDKASNDFADASERLAEELSSIAEQLSREVDTGSLRDAVSKLIKINKECLSYGRMNTTVKANALLKLEILPALERIAQIDKRTGSQDTASNGPSSELASLSFSMMELFSKLAIHVATD